MHSRTRIIYTCLFLFELLSLPLQLASVSSELVVLILKSCHLLIFSETQVGHFGFELVDPGLLADTKTIDMLDVADLFVIHLHETQDSGYLAHGRYAHVHILLCQISKADVGRIPGDLGLHLAFSN